MRFVWTSVVLGALWCLLSGKFDALHLGLGAASAAAVAAAVLRRRRSGAFPLLGMPRYGLSLAAEIVRSNLRVARIVLGSGRIAPRFMRVRHGVQSDWALCVLGCSVTLTPGTVTVDLDRETMLVHVLDERSAADMESGEMARRVAAVFGEGGGS